MTDTQHTPYRIDSMPLPASGYIVIKDSNCSEVCRIYKQGKAKYYQMPKEMRANAKFIVKACNNHDALVEALELIMDNLGWVTPVNGFALMPSETFIKIKKVLEQAKE